METSIRCNTILLCNYQSDEQSSMVFLIPRHERQRLHNFLQCYLQFLLPIACHNHSCCQQLPISTTSNSQNYENNYIKPLIIRNTTYMMSSQHNSKLMDLLHTDVPEGLSKTTQDSVTAIILDFHLISQHLTKFRRQKKKKVLEKMSDSEDPHPQNFTLGNVLDVHARASMFQLPQTDFHWLS